MFIALSNKIHTVILNKSELLYLEFNHGILKAIWKLKGEQQGSMKFENLDDLNENLAILSVN